MELQAGRKGVFRTADFRSPSTEPSGPEAGRQKESLKFGSAP